MPGIRYTKWREELTSIQEAIDACDNDYYDWLDIYHSQGSVEQRSAEYKIERDQLVNKLNAHYAITPRSNYKN